MKEVITQKQLEDLMVISALKKLKLKYMACKKGSKKKKQ